MTTNDLWIRPLGTEMNSEPMSRSFLTLGMSTCTQVPILLRCTLRDRAVTPRSGLLFETFRLADLVALRTVCLRLLLQLSRLTMDSLAPDKTSRARARAGATTFCTVMFASEDAVVLLIPPTID